jgi:hypothetical protein
MKMKLNMKSMTVVAALVVTAGTANVGCAADSSYSEPDLVHNLPCANCAPRTKARYVEEHLYSATPAPEPNLVKVVCVNEAPRTKASADTLARVVSAGPDRDLAHNVAYINNAPRTKGATLLKYGPVEQVEIAPLK